MALRDLDGDDDYYMTRMSEILDENPKAPLPQHPARLLDHLYLGNQDNAEDYDLLPALGITHVLNCAGTRTFDLTKHRYPAKIGIESFLMIPAEDYDEFDILQYFPEAIAFLERARARGAKALVHCNLGVNRSGAIAAAYLMVSQRKPLLKVLEDLQSKRSLVLCNVGFRRQLLKYARARGLLETMEDVRGSNPQNPHAVSSAGFGYPKRGGNEAVEERRNGKLASNYGSRGEQRSNQDDPGNKSRNGINCFRDEPRGSYGSSEEDKYLSTNGHGRSKSRSASRHLDEDGRSSDVEEEEETERYSGHKSLSLRSQVVPVSKYGVAFTLEDKAERRNGFVSSASGHFTNSSSIESARNITALGQPNSYEATDLTRTLISPRSSSRSIRDASPSLSRIVPVVTIERPEIEFSVISTPATDRYLEAASRERYREEPRRDGPAFWVGGDSLVQTTPSSLVSSQIGDYAHSLANRQREERKTSSSLGSGYSSAVPFLGGGTVESSRTPRSYHVEPSLPPPCPSVIFMPARSYNVGNSESFKTTVKPRSYYHRKVIGRIPKYSDIDCDLLNPAEEAYKLSQLMLDVPPIHQQPCSYDYSSGPALESRRYSLTSARPMTPSSSSSYRPEHSLARMPQVSGTCYTGRSSSLSRVGCERATTPGCTGPSRSSKTMGSSYRPVTALAGYNDDLEADIAAYNGACAGFSQDLAMRGLGGFQATRVTAPPTVWI